jgi:hypothetical protein
MTSRARDDGRGVVNNPLKLESASEKAQRNFSDYHII